MGTGPDCARLCQGEVSRFPDQPCLLIQAMASEGTGAGQTQARTVPLAISSPLSQAPFSPLGLYAAPSSLLLRPAFPLPNPTFSFHSLEKQS